MRENFRTSLNATLKYEGQYSNHPKDPGGSTMRGVTQATYDGWRKRNALPPQSVRKISDRELEAIYRRDYWDRCRCDDLPSGTDLAVFDFAVNSGVGRAARYLQKVAGVSQDGIIGPRTIQAVEATEDCAAHLCDARLRFLKSLKTWPTFGRGWASRVADVRRKAIALSEAAPHVEEETVFDEVLDTIDWTRHPKEAARQAPPPAEYRDALHIYLVPAIIAFLGALSAQDWNDVFSDHPSVSISMIFVGAAAAAWKAAAPWWARMIWKGPSVA